MSHPVTNVLMIERTRFDIALPALVVLATLCIPAYAQTPASVTAPSGAAAQLAAERLAAEREFWASVKASEDPADIRAYLEQFPGGAFEALARNRLKRLEEAAQPRAPQVTAVPTQEAASGPSSSPESVEEALGLTRAQRVLVQRGLTALGFDVGAADGIVGARTRAGIGKWQSSRGETATGYLDAGAVETLLKAGEAAPPKPQKMAGRKATGLLSEALSEALPTVRSIKDAYSRALTLSAIAEAQANAGDARGAAQTISDALSTARSIKDASYRAQALGYIAGAQAIAGDIQVALSTVRSIKDAHSRALALGYIAGVQASAGDIQIALSTARTIKRASLRARAFSAIAEAQANAGDTRGAAQTVSDALSAARSIGDAYSRVLALSAIARAQAGAGDTRGAAQTISEALSIARSIERAVPRVTALSAIAKAQAKAGDTRGAAQTISEGLSTARSIGDASSLAWARSDIAGAQASAGDIEIALSTARTIKRAFLRAKALRAIAEAQANAGDIQGSLSTARNIEDVSTYAWALRDIAKAQVGAANVRTEPSAGAAERAAADSDSPAVAGKCGAFVVYNSGPYPREHYPDMPDEDIWTWTWDRPTVQAARDAAKSRCLERWAKKNFSVDQAENFCQELAGIFCTDKAELKGWGVDVDSHNRCGALAQGDDHISYSRYYSGPTHVYRVGKGPTKKAAEQDALRKCRNAEADKHQGNNNPVSNCRIAANTAVCNSR